MDDIVRRAIARWPNVPAVYGWLRLDARGRWHVRTAGGDDERVMHRAAGVFQPIVNPQISAFIGRNYDRDARGAYYFQNGPQRVYVELAYTPFVYRLADDRAGLIAHSGAVAGPIAGAWFDADGALVIDAPPGPGVILDRDLAGVLAAMRDVTGAAIEDQVLERAAGGALQTVALFASTFPLGRIAATELAARFGYLQRPAPVE